MLEGVVLDGLTTGVQLSAVVETILQNDDGDGNIVLFVVALIVGSVLFGADLVVNAVRMYRKEQLVRNTPLANTRSVVMGRTDVQGTARPVEEPLSPPFTDGECLYAGWVVKEVRTRSEETKTWKTVAEGSYGQRFYLEDDTGQVVVENPRDSDVIVSDQFETEIEVNQDEEPPRSIPDFCEKADIPAPEEQRKYEQVIVPPETDVMIFGGAARLQDREQYDSVDDILVSRDRMTKRFMLTDEAESEFVTSVRRRAIEVVAGLVLMAVPLYLVLKFFSLLL